MWILDSFSPLRFSFRFAIRYPIRFCCRTKLDSLVHRVLKVWFMPPLDAFLLEICRPPGEELILLADLLRT